MTAYRKRPVVIDAVQLTGETVGDIARSLPIEAFAGASSIDGDVHLLIRTLEGVMRADEGDWIVTGTRGERYPVKPEIFAETYEAVLAP